MMKLDELFMIMHVVILYIFSIISLYLFIITLYIWYRLRKSSVGWKLTPKQMFIDSSLFLSSIFAVLMLFGSDDTLSGRFMLYGGAMGFFIFANCAVRWTIRRSLSLFRLINTS